MRNYEKNKISIILPTFNESRNIKEVLNDLTKLLKKSNFEIIVIDDKSNDNTAKIILHNFKKISNIILVQREISRSLIDSVKMGIQISSGEICVVMDSDGQHTTKDLIKMLKEIVNNDLVIGVRDLKNIKFLSKTRIALSTFFNWCLFSMFIHKVNDPLTGFFIFKSRLLNKKFFNTQSTGFKVLIDFLYSIKNEKIKIKEHTISFQERKFGTSKLNFAVFFSFITQLFSLNIGSVLSPSFIGFLLIGLSGMFIYLITFVNLFFIFNVNYSYSYILAVLITTLYNYNMHNYLNYFEIQKFLSMKYCISIVKYYMINLPGLFIGLNIALILKEQFLVNIILSTLGGISVDFWLKYYLTKIWILKRDF